MMATYSPRSISIDTPLSAWISSSPITYVFQRSRVSINAMQTPYGRHAAPVPLLLFLVLIPQLRHHAGVGQGGRVAQRLAFGDVPEQPPHDLAGTGLWQIGGKDD